MWFLGTGARFTLGDCGGVGSGAEVEEEEEEEEVVVGVVVVMVGDVQ